MKRIGICQIKDGSNEKYIINNNMTNSYNINKDKSNNYNNRCFSNNIKKKKN